MVTIIAATNVGGGLYRLQFSQPVTWTITRSEFDIIFRSTAAKTWTGSQTTAQPAADTIEFEQNDDLDDCIRVAIMSQPVSITSVSGDLFAVAIPAPNIV